MGDSEKRAKAFTGVGLTERPGKNTEIVKKKLAKKLAKLAAPLLASGAIEPPVRPLDIPPRRARRSPQKK